MSATPHLTSGVPNGTEPIGDVQTLSRSYTNSGGQVVERRVLQPDGMTYSHRSVPRAPQAPTTTRRRTATTRTADRTVQSRPAPSTARSTTARAGWSAPGSAPTTRRPAATGRRQQRRPVEHGRGERRRLRQRRRRRRQPDAGDRLPRRRRRPAGDRLLLRLARPAGGRARRACSPARTTAPTGRSPYTTYDNLDEVDARCSSTTATA